MGIFSDNAPRYWEKGLPVIPLAPRNKMPIPAGWSAYAEKIPPVALQQSWLQSHPDGNIGLVLGPQSGISMVDIDTPDERIVKVIESVLPPSPWCRIGKKGKVLAYKFSGHRGFRIKDIKGNVLVEILSNRQQVVLPPSIHPETHSPYSANCHLTDVLDQLCPLPKDIETILRAALEDAGIQLSLSGSTRVTDFISVGARDNMMVSFAGIMAQGIWRGELTLLEAFGRMDVWCESFVEKVAGDDIDPEKGKEKIVQFLLRDVLGEKRRTLPRGWDDGLSDEEKRKMGLNVLNDEHEEWTYTKVVEYLKAEFAKFVNNSEGRETAVSYILDRLARSTQIDPLKEDRILNWIVKSADLDYTLSALRSRLKSLRQGGIKGQDHTELAAAVLRDLNELGELRFDKGQFWVWGGSHWKPKPEAEILRYIAEEYGDFTAARRQSDHRGILRVMEVLAAKLLQSDATPGINFANGYLIADKLVLEEHHKEYGMTYTLPFRYLPELAGRCPKFFDFLHSIWGEDLDFTDKVQALREAIAVTLAGLGPRFQRAILLYGLPKSGKTQLLRIVQGLMPDETISVIPPQDWGDRHLPAELHGKLLNIAGELSEDKYIRGELFKTIVEGSEISAQRKYQQPFKFAPRATHWFASNHLPRTKDTSDGFNRRWLILEFPRAVRPESQEADIGIKIVAEEREAIVAWACEVIPDLLKRPELTLPESHKRVLREVANQNNSVRYFLTEGARVKILDPATLSEGGSRNGRPITMTELHDAYLNFCYSVEGVSPVRLRKFNQMMKELAYELGIKTRISLSEAGTEVIEYENITLV